MPHPDTLNSIGVLKRREIEARILAPFVEALGAEFGRERVVEILRQTIITLGNFRAATEAWKKDDALQLEVLEQSDDRYSFNVTRCRYAEMYRALGIPELGAVLSCNRDYSLIEGYNPSVELTRTQTLMQGASHCDFRYVRRNTATEEPQPNPGHEARR